MSRSTGKFWDMSAACLSSNMHLDRGVRRCRKKSLGGQTRGEIHSNSYEENGKCVSTLYKSIKTNSSNNDIKISLSLWCHRQKYEEDHGMCMWPYVGCDSESSMRVFS